MLGWPAGPGFWGIVRHADVQYVNRHPELFSSQVGATQIRDPAPEDLAFVQEMMLNMDPPRHTKLRRVVARLFTPREVAARRLQMEHRAAEIVDRVAGRDSCDFAQDLAADLPLLTLAEVMGMPPRGPAPVV